MSGAQRRDAADAALHGCSGGPDSSSTLSILPVLGVVFLMFAVIGMALPTVPLFAHDGLGFSPTVVGLIGGAQFGTALVSRLWAGRLADRRGPKRAVVVGLAVAVAGGALCLASLTLAGSPVWAVSVLLVGRAGLGGAESLVITGSIIWAIGRAAPEETGKAISWAGMAMFAALALGAPLGSLVYGRWSFLGVALATTVVPLLALVLVHRLPALLPVARREAGLATVLSAVMLPGVGFALSGITFGAVTSFLTLYFSVSGWSGGAMAFTSFAAALIATRLVGGHLPDRLGGARIAGWSLVVQALGLATVSLADAPGLAIFGAALTGVGFSLVFPGLGMEAVRRAPPGSSGVAMGTYNAFLDATLGFGSPVLGLLATAAGLGSVFLASGIAALAAIPIALRLQRPDALTPSRIPHPSPGPTG